MFGTSHTLNNNSGLAHTLVNQRSASCHEVQQMPATRASAPKLQPTQTALANRETWTNILPKALARISSKSIFIFCGFVKSDRPVSGGLNPSLHGKRESPKCDAYATNAFNLRQTSSTLARELKAEIRKYPSPAEPKPEPGVMTTCASPSILSNMSQELRPAGQPTQT